jgi:hypothetical protein
MENADTAVVHVGGEEPLAVRGERQRPTPLAVQAVAGRLGLVVERSLLALLHEVHDRRFSAQRASDSATATASARGIEAPERMLDLL